MLQLVLASHNAHKLEEIRRILEPLVPGVDLIGYDGPEPVENGVTFESNALLKARVAAAHTGLPAIADDSGIAVDVLGGSPGVFSARWGGPARNDRANVELLLWQLSDLEFQHRAASFVCAAAFVLPAAAELTADAQDEANDDAREFCERGEWRGTILREPIGDAGFGYDPVFLPEHESRSAAQLSPAEKDALSHRRRAFTALAPHLLRGIAL